MKQFILITIYILSSITLWANRAETDANINGHIIDKETKEHVPFVNVAIKGTTIGTVSDETGHFFLKNLPTGPQVVVISGVGYKRTEKEVNLQPNETIELNFTIELDNIQLDAVVVSANKNETSRKEAPVVVNVLSQKLFETTNSVCLAQGLNFQPGLRVENNCQNCGFQQVRINGLDGPYTQILLDSKPLFSSLSGVYGIEQIPTEMIERVEVMRGGGSALFGANAIAGTVNIITKEPLHNLFSISHNLTAIGGSSFDNVTNVNGSIVSEDRRSGIYLYGSNRERQAYDANGDDFSEVGIMSNTTFGFRTFYKPSRNSKLSLEYHNINEYRRGGNAFDKQPHEADIAEEAKHKIHGGGIDYKIYSQDYKHVFNVYSSFQNTNRKSYYGAGQDPNAYGNTEDLTALAGAQYHNNIDHLFFMPATLTAGTEFSYNNLHDVMTSYDRDLKQEVKIYSGYLQNEWHNEKFSFLVGARIDKHSLLNDPIVTPRANIRYNPSESVILRGSYSEGFRAPQAFDEDLHIAAVGGEMSIIELDPDLKKEKSRSYTASVDLYRNFGNVQTNLLIEGFYTKLSDVFVLEEVGEQDNGTVLFMRRNGGGAVVKGFNLEGKVAPHRNIQLQMGATIQSSKYDTIQHWSEDQNAEATRKILRSPDFYGYMTLNANITRRLSTAISGTYTGEMLVPHFAGYIENDRLEKTPDFWDMNIKFSYDIPLNGNYNIQLNCGVQNIFNQYQSDFDLGMDRDAGYIYGPGLPRSYFASIKFSLN